MKIPHKAKVCILCLAAVVVGYLVLANCLIYARIHYAGMTASDTKYNYMIIGKDANSSKLVYTAIGDSLTSGVGVDDYCDSYPYLVAEKVSQEKGATVELRTFSYPGASTNDVVRELLDPAIATNPDIITVLIGVNDIHGQTGIENFSKNYDYILGRLTKETHAKISLVNVPNIGGPGLFLPPYDSYFETQTDSFNEVVKSMAEKYGLKYIDLNGQVRSDLKKNDGYYSKDLFHPSAKGYRLWAQIIYDYLDK